MHRREFLLATASTVVFARPLLAQGQGRRLVGVLDSKESLEDGSEHLIVFRDTLIAAGWGPDDLAFEFRFSSGLVPLMREQAADLVSLSPDVLVGVSTPCSIALRDAAAGRFPIVFYPITDPVGSGLVPSLASPGGTLTGFTSFEFSMAGKWMDLLRQIDPSMSRVGVMFNPATTATFIDTYLTVAREAAPPMGIELIELPIATADEIPLAVASLAGGHSGLVVIPDALTTVGSVRRIIIDLAAQYRMPAVYPFDFFAVDGGLLSYGASIVDSARQAAGYVDRILRGANPGDLPVQGPTRFELIINLKTAAAMGVTIPDSLLGLANRLIE